MEDPVARGFENYALAFSAAVEHLKSLVVLGVMNLFRVGLCLTPMERQISRSS